MDIITHHHVTPSHITPISQIVSNSTKLPFNSNALTAMARSRLSILPITCSSLMLNINTFSLIHRISRVKRSRNKFKGIQRCGVPNFHFNHLLEWIMNSVRRNKMIAYLGKHCYRSVTQIQIPDTVMGCLGNLIVIQVSYWLLNKI